MKKMTRVERKKRNKKIVLIIFLSLLLITLIFQIMKRVKFFNINLIKVTGNKVLTDKEIIDLSEINIGDNIFDVKLSKAKKNIAESPYVKEVRSRRVYPARVNLHVVERDESFKIPYKGETMVLVDRQGRILKLGKPAGEEAILLKSIKIDEEIVNGDIGKSIKLFIKNKNVIDFFEYDSKDQLLTYIKEIDLKKNDITITLKEGQVVDFGGYNDMDYKFRLLSETFKYIKKDQIAFSRIIMNRGDNPIIIRDKEGG